MTGLNMTGTKLVVIKSPSWSSNRPTNNSPLYTKHVSGHLEAFEAYFFLNWWPYPGGREGMVTDHTLVLWFNKKLVSFHSQCSVKSHDLTSASDAGLSSDLETVLQLSLYTLWMCLQICPHTALSRAVCLVGWSSMEHRDQLLYRGQLFSCTVLYTNAPWCTCMLWHNILTWHAMVTQRLYAARHKCAMPHTQSATWHNNMTAVCGKPQMCHAMYMDVEWLKKLFRCYSGLSEWSSDSDHKVILSSFSQLFKHILLKNPHQWQWSEHVINVTKVSLNQVTWRLT